MLIQQLLMAKPDVLPELIKQNDAKIDAETFSLLSRLAQASYDSGDQQGLQLLTALQKTLLENSTYGKAAAEEAQETRDAINALTELSKAGLTREALLDLLIESADREIYLTTIATMARDGLDYTFFQILSDRIERASGDEKDRLKKLRERLLAITAEVDLAIQKQLAEARELLAEILKADNLEEAIQKSLPKMSQVFADVLNAEAEAAQRENDQEKLKKLVTIVAVMRQASESGAALDLIESLLRAPDEAVQGAILEEAGDAVNSDFMQLLGNLIGQLENQKDQEEILSQLKEINRQALRFSMQRNLNAPKQA